LREAIDLVTKGKSNGLTLITFDTGINEVNLTRGELTITTAMTIQGENVIIDAQNKNRILTINAKNQNVELTGLTFTNGKASNYGGAIYQLDGNVTLIGVTLTNNSARYGGAYYQKAGTSELIQATFTDNTASYGGAFYLYNGNASFFGGENETETLLANNVGTWGGAIYQNSANTLLVLNQVSFVENEASWGGAIYQNAGTLGVDNTTFIGNKASWGGALHLSGAKVLASLNYVEFIGNQATWGGALYQSAGSLNIEYSSFSGNSATWGGSLYLSGANSSLTLNTIEFASNTATWGGGIYQSAGTLSVENSSLTDNRATYGGSLYLSGGSATLTDTDILPPSDLKTRYGTSIGKLNGSRLTIIKNSVTIYDQAIQAYLDDLDEV